MWSSSWKRIRGVGVNGLTLLSTVLVSTMATRRLSSRIYLGGWELYRKRDHTGLLLERETLHVISSTRVPMRSMTLRARDPSAR